jgi:hypothetical protein
MRIFRAEHLGMCFGVRDAIELALEQSATEPLTVLGDLVHKTKPSSPNCAPGALRSPRASREWTRKP